MAVIWGSLGSDEIGSPRRKFGELTKLILRNPALGLATSRRVFLCAEVAPTRTVIPRHSPRASSPSNPHRWPELFRADLRQKKLLRFHASSSYNPWRDKQVYLERGGSLMRFKLPLSILLVVAFGSFVSPAHSQWQVSYLHPRWCTRSWGAGVSGADEVGRTRFTAAASFNTYGALWTGTAASYVNMNPAGALSSRIDGTDGVHQVGTFSPTPTIPPSHAYTPYFAGMWSGTPASMVSLHPSGGNYEPWSHALAVEGNIQTGDYEPNTEPYIQRGERWSGTAASHVALSSPGFSSAAGQGTDGTSIAGWVSTSQIPGSGPFHAALWTFGPNSFVDLNPAGALSSRAHDVEGNLQVGTATLGGGWHAVIWSGTAASVADVNPAGATSSAIYGIDGGIQVGSATFSGVVNNAGLWTGTAGSFLNLHSLLTPGTYSSSEASAVWTDGITTARRRHRV